MLLHDEEEVDQSLHGIASARARGHEGVFMRFEERFIELKQSNDHSHAAGSVGGYAMDASTVLPLDAVATARKVRDEGWGWRRVQRCDNSRCRSLEDKFYDHVCAQCCPGESLKVLLPPSQPKARLSASGRLRQAHFIVYRYSAG